jgi:hypothetical protein
MRKDALPVIAPRATAIARGLAATGRAAPAILVGNWLNAQARRGDRRESYYIDIAEGARLLRGRAQRGDRAGDGVRDDDDDDRAAGHGGIRVAQNIDRTKDRPSCVNGARIPR